MAAGNGGNGNDHDDNGGDVLLTIVDTVLSQGAGIRALMNAVAHQREEIAELKEEVEKLKNR